MDTYSIKITEFNCITLMTVFFNLLCRNSMCGKLQCVNVDLRTIPVGATVTIENINRSTCINADFNLGTDVLDPAYVNTGSPCEEGKVSVHAKVGL